MKNMNTATMSHKLSSWLKQEGYTRVDGFKRREDLFETTIVKQDTTYLFRATLEESSSISLVFTVKIYDVIHSVENLCL